MQGYVENIEQKALDNDCFREVLFTGPHCQLVVMSLLPGENIGKETHHGVDQFIRVESGEGKSILDGVEHELHDGSAIVIPSGVEHDIINLSLDKPLKLYTVY